MAAFNGKNVLFLQGTQSKLNTLMKDGGAQEGAFYLTNDTHRFYIGRTVGEKIVPVAVNEGVVTVASVDNLPTSGVNVGEFYYVTDGNILCVYSGNGFVQINSDTDTNSYITGISDTEVTSDTNGVTVSFNIKQKDVNKNGDEVAKHIGSDFTASIPVSFTIDKAHFDTVLPDNIAVGIDATENVDGSVKLSTTGTGADTTNIVNLKAGTNVAIDVSGDDITISAVDENTTYDLAGIVNNSKGQIQLQAKDGSENDNIYFESANDALTVKSEADKVIYTHKAYETTEGKNTVTSVAHKGSFIVVDSISTDKGHVTAWTSKEIVLPEDENTTNVSMAIEVCGKDDQGGTSKGTVNGKGSLYISLTDSNTNNVEAFVADALYNTVTVDGVEQTVYNQQSLGAFYSANKIDTLMQGVNAMTYKGTINAENGLPTKSIAVGDTYMVAEAGTYNGNECEVGDLLIAIGDEEDGFININTLQWTYVPSGNDTDTHYDVEVHSISDVDGAEIVLGNDVNTDEDKIQILGGTAIDVTPDATNSKITIAHENVARDNDHETKLDDEEPAHGTSFTVIGSVRVNEQGHVTSVQTKDITLPDDENTTYDLAGKDNKIVLTAYNGNVVDGVDEIAVTDDDKYITATVDNNELNIAHKSYTAETLSAAAGTATELAHEGSFTVLTGVTRDDGGHITGVTSGTWKLPKDENTTYSMSDHAVSAKSVTGGSGATVTTTLTGSDTSTYTANFDITSTSLKIDTNATNGEIAVNMVWGTF